MKNRKIIMAPGVTMRNPVSTPEDWDGKHERVAELIKSCIPGIQGVSVDAGTNGRPVDCISVTVDPDGPHKSKKQLTRAIETLVKNALGLFFDYRVVSIQ